MNNLVKIREQIQKEQRLHNARLIATKNGEVAPYRRSVYQERLNEVRKQFL